MGDETKLSKEELLEHLKYALTEVLCENLEGLDRFAMESSIDYFINESVSRYTSEEILEKFYTPEESIRLFTEFLQKTGALEDSDDKTLH